MPYIDAKLTGTVTPAQREVLKNELGQAIALMDKPECYEEAQSSQCGEMPWKDPCGEN